VVARGRGAVVAAGLGGGLGSVLQRKFLLPGGWTRRQGGWRCFLLGVGGCLPLALLYRALWRESVFSGLVFYACLLPALAGLVSSTAAAFSAVLEKFYPLFYSYSRVRAARFF
jgi:hypothetical protein